MGATGQKVYIYGIFRGSEWVIQENRITMQILPKLQVWCNYLCTNISGHVLATQKLGFQFLFLNQMQRSAAIAHLVFGGFQITRQSVVNAKFIRSVFLLLAPSFLMDYIFKGRDFGDQGCEGSKGREGMIFPASSCHAAHMR